MIQKIISLTNYRIFDKLLKLLKLFLIKVFPNSFCICPYMLCICYKEIYVYGNRREHENGVLLKNKKGESQKMQP